MPTHKRTLLEMLTPDPTFPHTGIESCPGGLGRILQQIRTNLFIPENPDQVIPWFITQFKEEVITQMVLEADPISRPGELRGERQGWKWTIEGLAHDPAHRGNGLIRAIGVEVGLDASLISRAEQDETTTRTSPLTGQEKQQLITAFRERTTPDNLVAYVLGKINSQADGSTGLKTLRAHMLQVLASRLAAEDPALEDPAGKAVECYYLSRGTGKPSDEGFTNFNEAGVAAYMRTLV